jgi:hypothetical protein
MATFTVSRVTALPGALSANTIYLVATGGDKVEIYVTGNTAAVRRVLTEADIQAMIDASVGSIGAVEVVANIAARDALALAANAQVLVIDASADPSVNAGAATYIYRVATDEFIKISEAEGLDLALAWANITGGPASTPAAIDTAVANSHTHANKTQLDKIGQDASGGFTYDGQGHVQAGSVAW